MASSTITPPVITPHDDAPLTTGSGDARPAHPAPDDRQPSDAELWARARAGDTGAFAAVYDRHAAGAYGLARRIVRSPTTAQDVVQEAFLSLWRADSYVPEKGSLRTFLLAIVRNRAIDALRREYRRNTADHHDDGAVLGLPAADRTDDEVEHREMVRFLRAALAKLPEAQHRAVELAFFGDLTHHEIALQLGEPVGTIKGRIRLGLEKLRAEIEPLSWN
jgi:RNA polymerase sigma-70 factor (ECF subfamily)